MNKGNLKFENELISVLEENGIIIDVMFSAEYYPTQKEYAHGIHETGDMWLITLEKVSLKIADKALPLLENLNDAQKQVFVKHCQDHIDHLQSVAA